MDAYWKGAVSLIERINSLFGAKISLFRLAGNSIKKSRKMGLIRMTTTAKPP
jgi:hypothetical protein